MDFCILPAQPSPGTLEELATHLPRNWRTNINDHEGIWGTPKQQAPGWPPYPDFSLLEGARGPVCTIAFPPDTFPVSGAGFPRLGASSQACFIGPATVLNIFTVSCQLKKGGRFHFETRLSSYS